MARKTVTAKFGKMDKAFKSTTAYANLVAIGASAFEPLLEGGFKSKINSRQSSWKDLDSSYARQKILEEGAGKKWIRTGKLLKAVHGNPIEKTGTKRGLNFKIRGTAQKTTAIILPTTYGHHLDKQNRPNAAMKRRIHSLLDFRRPLFRWDRPDMPDIEESVAAAIQKTLRKSGLSK